jgi:hypothetical protein
MTDEEPKHLCDACGDPIIGEHDTDDEVCGTGDGPGFLLCRVEDCVTRRPAMLRHRRQFYARQRKANEARHSYTAESRLSFHVEMSGESVDEDFGLGDLLNMSTDEIAALGKDELSDLIRSAFDDWQGNHVSGGWEIE